MCIGFFVQWSIVLCETVVDVGLRIGEEKRGVAGRFVSMLTRRRLLSVNTVYHCAMTLTISLTIDGRGMVHIVLIHSTLL